MDFEKAFDVFMCWQTAILCLGIYCITFSIRTVVEYYWKKSKVSTLWNELFLPLGPIGTGAILGFVMVSFPWPVLTEGSDQASIWSRVLYSCTCGLLSGWAYNRLKSWMKATENTKLPFSTKSSKDDESQ